MSVELYPCFLQDEEYSAETLRHVFGTLLARGSAIGSIAGGLVAPTDMQVTAGSGMQVLVATGEAWIPGTSVTTQGGYLGRVTSSTALAISASSESNPRIETIIAQVKDKAVAGGTDSFSVNVVTGTATSGATLANKLGAGSVPASSLVLAYVLVPAKAVSIVSGDIENVATLATSALPPSLPSARISHQYSKAEAEAGHLISSRYVALVTGWVESESAKAIEFLMTAGSATVAAVQIPAGLSETLIPFAFVLEPGESWKMQAVAGVSGSGKPVTIISSVLPIV